MWIVQMNIGIACLHGRALTQILKVISIFEKTMNVILLQQLWELHNGSMCV